MKIVSFGEIMVRLGAPDYLKLVQSNTFEVSYAGAEANVAVSLANYGMQTDYVTCLPDNPIAERCIMELRGHKVGVDHIQRSGKRMGILYLETGSNARPSKVYYDREDSSIATVALGSIDWDEILKDANWFHWTGITPAISQSCADVCLEAVQVANRHGVKVSCDLNYRKNLWKYGKTASEIMPALVAGCDVIIGNEEDAEKVFGIKPDGFNAEDGVIETAKFQFVAKSLMERFPKASKVAITLRGSINADHNTWGAVLYDGKTLFSSRRYDITHIVDRVGGGDSFGGGLIHGLLSYNDDQKALDFAVAASCLKHTIEGDYNRVTANEVETLMNGNGSGRVSR